MAEIVVNTSAMGQYAEPVVTKLASGGWVVVWHNDQNGIDLAAQIYNAQGAKVGAEFKVNTSTAGYQTDATVGALPGGGFVVSWIDQDNSYGIRTQRFDAAGVKVGGETAVTTSPATYRQSANVSVAPDGSYIVSWQSVDLVNGSQTGVNWIARYDAAGNKIGNDLSFASLNNLQASWVALSDGHFAVAYGAGYEARAAFLDIGAGPVALGASFLLNDPQPQTGPTVNLSLVRLSNGNLAATWLGNDTGVSSRVFGTSGTIGAEASVLNRDIMLNDLRIGALADGGYAVSWTERASSSPSVYASMARTFDSTGDAIGGAFQVNLSTVNSAAAASIVGLDAGHIVTVHPGPNVMMQILDVPTRQSGTASGETLTGTARPDEIHGLDGNDTIDGLAGADEIYGDNGADNLTGGAGHDSIAGDAGADQLFGGDGNDRLYAAQAAPEIPFQNGFEAGLDHGLEIDTLSGGAGNDKLFAGLGDTVDGGADSDSLYLSVSAASSGVTVNLSTPGAALTVAGASITNVEHLGWFDGSAFNDVVIGGPQSEIPGFDWGYYGTIHGNGGNDQLTAGYYTPYVYGDAGNDTITGSDNWDFLYGGAGADTISGGIGNDFLSSSDVDGTPSFFNILFGADRFDRGTEIDTLSGGADDDTVNIGYGDSADGGTHYGAGDALVISLAGATSGVTVNFNATTMVIGGGTITGFEKIDFVEGSDFADSITFTSTYGGDQNVIARGGNDIVVGGSGTRYVDGGDGDDDIDVRSSGFLQSVVGGAGNDTIRMSGSVSEARGGDGNDTIYGYRNVHGDAGNDLIILAAGSPDSIFSTGGTGDDEMRASSTGSRLAGNSGADHLIGGDGADFLYSGDFVSLQSIVADIGTEHDVIEAGGGNDIVAIGYGDDADGGTGTDTLTVSLAGAASGVTLSTGSFVGGPFSLGGATIQNFETLSTLSGTGFDDVITASAQATALTVNGGDGNDTLIATTGATTLAGGNGNDRLVSGTAIDTLSGGAGIDTADFGALGAGITLTLASTTLGVATASNGDRVTTVENVTGTNFADTLTGNIGVNALSGLDGNDTLDGAGGDDTLDGGTGADAMTGGAGSDTFTVDNAGDTVTEGNTGNADTDTVNTSVSWTIGAGQEIERLRAAPGTDPINLTGNALGQKIIGNDGVNSLTGGGGNDNLMGGGGADLLIGGTGLDKLTGGDGADRFVFEIGGQMDRIVDFTVGSDKIDLLAFGGMTFQQVMNATTENAGITTINLGGGDLVQLVGVAKASLSAGDFLLGGGAGGVVPWPGGDLSLQAAILPVEPTPMATITGDDGNNTLGGTGDDDIISGLGGNDTITGGNGADYLFGDSGDPAGLYGDDTISGQDGNDFVVGGRGNDTLSGGTGDDTLVNGVAYIGTGMVGSFTPYPGILSYYGRVDGGNDVIDGGDGDDLAYLFYNRAQGITLDNSNAAAVNTILSGGVAAGSITKVERLQFWGGDGVDTITGGALTDTLFGLAGNDVLHGGDGGDNLEGGAGDDVIDGGSGAIDLAGYFSAAAGVTVDLRLQGSAQNTVGDGSDTLTGIEGLVGSMYTDSLTGDSNVNFLADYGGGNDQLFGLGGNDILAVIRYNQWLGATNVLLDGGDDNDSLSVEAMPGTTIDTGTLLGGAGNDTLTIIGAAGSFTLEGGTGLDVLTGGGGDDLFKANDVTGDLVTGEEYHGGAGTDTLQVNTGASAIDLTGIVLDGIETLQVGPLTVTGDPYLYVKLTPGQVNGLDNIYLSTGRLELSAGGTINLAGAHLQLMSIVLDHFAASTLDLSGATISGFVGPFIFGGIVNDTITGSVQNDYIYGVDGDDRLDGGTGADTMTGGTGNDTFIVDNAGDSVFESDTGNVDTDTVNAYISWTMGAGQEIERLRAAPGTDPINLTGNEFGQKITGNNGINTLTGGGGNDNLNGGGGADVLVGGTGLDKLTGGDGADIFVMQAGGQMDRILDFATGTDKIDLSTFGMTFQQVLNATTEAGGISTINLGGGDSVQLIGVTKASLSIGDFVLGGSSGGVPWIDALESQIGDGGTADIVADIPGLLPSPFHTDMWHGGSDWHAL